MLRLKAGTLNPAEASPLLEPLPGLLDALASSGLSLVAVWLSKLWARFPPDLESAKFESWVKRATAQDWDSRLVLDPLSLRSLVSRPVQPESDVTLLPTSRSLALQQNRAGIQGRTPARLLAGIIYELLAGQPPQTDSYRPLAALPDNANQRLRHALAHQRPDQSSASELWLALKADFPQARKVHTPTHQQQAKPVASTGPTPPTPANPPVQKELISFGLASADCTSAIPAEPLNKPLPFPTPASSTSQKTSRTRPRLILGLLAALICIVLLAWLASHSRLSQPSPAPTRTPTPSNYELASAAFDRGDFKGGTQLAFGSDQISAVWE